MDKHNGILYSHSNEWSITTHINVDDSCQQDGKGRKPDTKEYVLHDSICINRKTSNTNVCFLLKGWSIDDHLSVPQMCSLSSLGLCTSFRFSQNYSSFGLHLGAEVMLEFGLMSLTHLDLNPTQSSDLRLGLPCSRKPSMTPCNLGTLYFPVIALPHWTVIVYIRLAAPHDQTHQPCCLLLHPQGQAHSRHLTNICWKNGGKCSGSHRMMVHLEGLVPFP